MQMRGSFPMSSKHLSLIALAAVAGAFYVVSSPAAEPAANDLQKPFLVYAGDAPLDTGPLGGGHAAPFMIDLNGDGKRDLVVGSISGRFHFHKNIGTDTAPKFGEGEDFLKT